MKNIIIEIKDLKKMIDGLTPIINDEHRKHLKSLKQRFGVEFTKEQQENIRMLYDCVIKEIMVSHSPYSYKLQHPDTDNPYTRGEIVREYSYINIPDEYKFIHEWQSNVALIQLSMYNAENQTNITLSDIAFANSLEDILVNYTQEACDRQILKQTKEIHKVIESLFAGKTPNQVNALNTAIRIYLTTNRFTDLHNYLVQNYF